jgi:hypothetical protein
MEAQRGRRVAIIEPESRQTVTEIVSPSLSQAEWVAHRERVVLSEKDMKRVGEMVAHPRAPKDTLRRALAKEEAVATMADCTLVTDPISEGDAAGKAGGNRDTPPGTRDPGAGPGGRSRAGTRSEGPPG